MATEQELAGQQNASLQLGLISSRKKWIALCAIFSVVGLAFSMAGFWMFALCAFMLGAIFLSSYFDANGHLHEVRRRSKKSLVPDFSTFGSPSDESTSSPEVGSQISRG